MDKVLKFYKLVNGVEMPFPSGDEQIVTSDFTYTAQRMGGAPTITCTVRHSYALDTDDKVDYMLWSDMVYAEFNGEKYYLLRTPTSTYDNTDRRYKYDVEMVSERVILDNVYLFDVAQMGERPDAADRYRGVTNSTKIPFYGDINDFARLLNNSLAFSGLYDPNTGEGYHVKVDDGVVSESHSIEFSDQFFSNALQEAYNTFEIPYYFVGKAIHIGTAPNDAHIGSALSYGSDNALLSISKQNANSKLINRITGVGDTRNLPYYYPNETPKGQVDIYVPDGNKILNSSHLSISSPTLAHSRLELNNPVTFSVMQPNTLEGTDVSDASISTIHYKWRFSPDTIMEGAIGVNEYGDAPSGYRAISPLEKDPFYYDNNRGYEGRMTYKYHVWVSFSTLYDSPDTLRWIWEAFPYDPLIQNQSGKIEYKVFDNLKVYEIIDGKEHSIEHSIQGDYPSLYIDTPFKGSSNNKGGLDVTIHMEFVFWKHRIDGKNPRTFPDDFITMNFKDIRLSPSAFNEVRYTWQGSTFSSSDISDFGLTITDSNLRNELQQNPSQFVGESFGLKQISYITPSTNLMPSIYRESLGAERFYSAENNKYELGDGYYHFNNPYVDGKPKEHIENFDDIYPSIKGMVNERKVPMDRFIEFAYDEGDNDETNPNDDNKLYHPFFYAKLPKLNGDFGFNLFDYASESGAMQITMTSGQCGACTFEIAVDEQTQKNKVQVDENGNLVYDADGKVALGNPQDKQNDTVNNEVWIALRKDINTYPSTMPNVGEHNKPKANEDTFVILNINMPQSYIRAAEKRLDDALIYYMSQHNDEKFNFGIKFSRIYLEEHPEVLSKISENSSVTIDYNNQTPTLYISSFTYRMQPSAILPEITVDLVDKLTVHRNVIENAVSQIKGEILERIASIDFLRQGVRHFVRKDVDDTVNGRLRLNKGFESSDDASFGKFKEDTKGAGIYQDESGKWHIEADYLKARNKIVAKSVEIEEAHHIGGQQMLTSASARIDYVVERENAYRCYFLKRDTSGDTIYNKWMVGDQAYCKYFNVENTPTDNTSGIIQKYYWRLVVATSNDTADDNITLDIDGNTIITSEYHFIDLSKTQCDGQSDVPQTQDNIVQLGHQGKDKDRQNAIVMAGAGDGSPYIRQYVGIKSFNLPEADTQIKPNDNVFTGKMVIKSGSTGLSGFNEWEGVEKDINDAKQDAQYAKEQVNLANASIGNLNDVIEGLNESIFDINSRLDGVVENFFEEGAPTLDNYPANEWTTEEEKKNHIGDTYTDVSTTGETAGKSWRWLDADSEHSGYHWHPIADTDALKALALAKEAKATADGKIRTFVGMNTPTPPYDKGDLWVQGSNGDVLVCKTSKIKGESYDLNDWQKASKYTDDSKANEVEEQLNNLSTGAGNLIRNSGFTGDYVTSQLKDGTSLSEAFQTYSPSLQHWESKDAIAITGGIAITSESGKAVHLTIPSAYIKQTLTHYVKKGEDYVLSFYAKGAQMTVTFAGVKHIFTLTNEKQRYVLKLKAIDNSNIITFMANVEAAYICDIMLEKGSVVSAWDMSKMDNISAMAEYEKTTYLQQLLKIDTTFNEGDATLRTGVINTGLIQMGNLNDEGKLAETTAGMSGIYNGGDSVAFFGGGTWEKAIATVTKFKDNPNYQPTEAELASMAKAVITHGGRAILQDIILRGYVYAQGGVFNGTVYAENGVFNGIVRSHLSYSPTRLIGEETYNIDPNVEPYSYFWYWTNRSAMGEETTTVFLPSAQDYEGLEINFYLVPPTTRGGGHHHVVSTINDENIVFSANEGWVSGLDGIEAFRVQKHDGLAVSRTTLVMTAQGEYCFKAINGNWYALKGLFTEES